MFTEQQKPTDDAQARDRLWALIEDIRLAMFTTPDGNGHLHSRPMTTQNSNLDEDNGRWRCMSLGSEPVADLMPTRRSTSAAQTAGPTATCRTPVPRGR